MTKPDLEFILERLGTGNAPEDFRLFACRGAGKGCTRNKHRTAKVHCEDCVPADDPNETLEHFKARLERGNA